MAGLVEARAILAPRVLLAAITMAFLATLAAGSNINRYTLNIATGDVRPDGVNRVACLINGQFPGTLIAGNKGEWVQRVCGLILAVKQCM